MATQLHKAKRGCDQDVTLHQKKKKEDVKVTDVTCDKRTVKSLI